MSEPFIAEIKMFSFGFAPRGWAQCNGQILPIAQNTALFSILLTNYGGNGQTTFALPNLQGCAPVHNGNEVSLGQNGGEQTHTLTINEMPQHIHTVNASAGAVSGGTPTSNYLTTLPNDSMFTIIGNGALGTQLIGGGSQPHNNMQPYTVLNFCMALVGIFPSRN